MQSDSEFPKLLACPLCNRSYIKVVGRNKKFYGICRHKDCQAETQPCDSRLETYHVWNKAIGIHGHGVFDGEEKDHNMSSKSSS